MTYKALLFDLDDTLLDFAVSENSALNKVHEEFLSALVEKDLFKEEFRIINRALWDLVAEGVMRPDQVKNERFRQVLIKMDLTLDVAQMGSFYEGVLGEEVSWLPGAESALDTLRAKFPVGIVTNGLKRVQEKKYRISGLSSWCSCFIISESVGIAKPDKRIFDLAFNALEVQPQDVLMVGDSAVSDYQGAINCAMDFCWINPAGARLPAGFPQPKFDVKSVAELAEKLLSMSFP